MCRRDHLVAGLYTKSPQGDVNRVCPIRAGDAAFHANRARPCLLKGVHVPPTNVSRLGDDFGNRAVDLLFDRQVLRVQINKGDFHEAELKRSEVRPQRSALKTAKKACWIACVNSGNGNILGNNCASSDNYLVADRHRKDRGICSIAHAIAMLSRSPELRVVGGSAGTEQVVNKHRAVGNEAFVSDGYELTDECVRLNPASLAERYSLLYLYKRTDEAAISNRAPIEVDWLDHRYVFTKCYIDNPCMPDFWLCHRGLAYWLN